MGCLYKDIQYELVQFYVLINNKRIENKRVTKNNNELSTR